MAGAGLNIIGSVVVGVVVLGLVQWQRALYKKQPAFKLEVVNT